MTSKILLFFFTLSLFCSCLNNNSNKTEEEKPTYKISSLVDTFKNSSEEIPELKQIDSAKIIELKKYVNIKKDEFKETNWYTPKTAPLYRNQNGIYCYFFSRQY